jgi:hypothetical protein
MVSYRRLAFLSVAFRKQERSKYLPPQHPVQQSTHGIAGDAARQPPELCTQSLSSAASRCQQPTMSAMHQAVACPLLSS